MKKYQSVIIITVFSYLLFPQAIAAQNPTSEAFKACNVTTSSSDSAVNKETKSAENESKVEDENSKPSLWWAREQFDPFGGRLVENWLTDAHVQQINLVVNWQLWTLLDYLGRYRFVNQFGTVARRYGYNLNIFNQKKQCLASYKYNAISNPPKWEINLEQLGKNSLQVEPADL